MLVSELATSCPCGISPIADCHRHGAAARLAAQSATRPRRPLDAWEVILLAAGGLGETFSRTAIVLAAWRADPKRFGLAGAEHFHPDANKVFSLLCGSQRLSPRIIEPLTCKVGKGLYSLTAFGRAELYRLRGAK